VNAHGFDVLSIGETMALFVADVPGPLAQAQHFSKRLAGATRSPWASSAPGSKAATGPMPCGVPTGSLHVLCR